MIYEVINEDKKFTVNMKDKTCTCKIFQADELPCKHAAAVINKKLWDPYQFCSYYYKNDTLKATYAAVINPISSEDRIGIPEDILEEVVDKPAVKPKAGKPRKRRIRSLMEKIKENHCGRCGNTKHNRRSCTNKPTKDI